MSISTFKSKKGMSFYATLQINGKRYKEKCDGCHTMKEAQQYEKDMRKRIESVTAPKDTATKQALWKEIYNDDNAITFEKAIVMYLDGTPRKRTDVTVNRNKRNWEDFTAFMHERHPDVKTLPQVTRQHAEEYMGFVRENGLFIRDIAYVRNGVSMHYENRNTKLSNRAINDRHITCKAVFAHLQPVTMMVSNPFDFPKMKKDAKPREVFSDEEIKMIIDASTMPITRPFFITGFCTGLTEGDICLLKWSDIAQDGPSEFYIRKERRKTGVQLNIPIMPALLAFLEEVKGMQEEPQEYCFPELAQMYTANPTGVNYRIKKVIEGLNIATAKECDGRYRKISVKGAHALRHTFATRLLDGNVPIAVAQSLLGHASATMTMHYQQHATGTQVRKMISGIDFTADTKTTALPASETAQLPPPADANAELIELIKQIPAEMVNDVAKYLKRKIGKGASHED